RVKFVSVVERLTEIVYILDFACDGQHGISRPSGTQVALETVALPVNVEDPKSLEPANVAQIGVARPRKPSVSPGKVPDSETMIDKATHEWWRRSGRFCQHVRRCGLVGCGLAGCSLGGPVFPP